MGWQRKGRLEDSYPSKHQVGLIIFTYLIIFRKDWARLIWRKAVVMGYIAPQQGMNWRDYMGNIICFIGHKVIFRFPSLNRLITRLRSVGWICHVWIFQARQNKEAMEDLKRQLSAAEEILAKRQIHCVEDLNIGDLSAFMEISVPMECLVGFQWEDYPNLNKLHQVNISHPQTLCMFEQHWE